jgi:serine/threonine protein kinase
LKALGINALHEMGIIHRDIKAENILIAVRENMRIADFGLSYVDENEGPLDRQWAYMTSAVETTYCMAPEILHSRFKSRPIQYGTPVDWWALGCVVYQLILKRHKARLPSLLS